MLYALSIEPMLHNIRFFIDGLVLSDCDTCFNLSVYADDIIVIITNQDDDDFWKQLQE